MGGQINTWAALHCVQQNQGCFFFFFWRVVLECVCERVRCVGSWPCSTQTQQLRLRLAEKKNKNVKHTYTYCNVCLDLSLTLFLDPFPTFTLTTTLKDTASPLFLFSLQLPTSYSNLQCRLFFSILFCSPSQQLLVKVQGQQISDFCRYSVLSPPSCSEAFFKGTSVNVCFWCRFRVISVSLGCNELYKETNPMCDYWMSCLQKDLSLASYRNHD